ncbi:MAG: hypothetical protein WBB76_09560 [Gaiellaceae bacterium]
MNAVLGLLGLVVFAACIIAFAAAITWLVVRLSPRPRSAAKQP